MQVGEMDTVTRLGDTEQTGTREEMGITEGTGVMAGDTPVLLPGQ
jgi:hypothetical protein